MSLTFHLPCPTVTTTFEKLRENLPREYMYSSTLLFLSYQDVSPVPPPLQALSIFYYIIDILGKLSGKQSSGYETLAAECPKEMEMATEPVEEPMQMRLSMS